ncbi:FAD-dependent oxidoreductase [Fusibacter sp. 3D3]|uniref:FAD-dependent oxidoreductase n=1 Tax=Fusibacter sp. 3D3 TaxID=1048380 RepID=UPI001A9A4DC9|nr:FAD-dependent oxidoreductase [Fusibacter sp. 3D3]
MDLVFVAIGAYPNVSLAEKMELELDEKKSIKVNVFQQTSNENIFAIGDCASKSDIFTGKASNVRLASIAAKEGRNAAINLLKQEESAPVQGIMNLFSTSINNVYYAAAGMTKHQCEQTGFQILEVRLNAPNMHPGTLPGMVMTNGTFFFDKATLKLLGVQLSGDKAVAEMINAFGIAIQNHATAKDLYSYNYGTHPLGTASPNVYIMHQTGLYALAKQKSLI